MKKIAVLLFTFLCVLSFVGCNERDVETFPSQGRGTDGSTEHAHQWQDVSGEHARICTECDKKKLKSEACNFVRESCDQPMACTVCHALDESSIESHEWTLISESNDCWSTTETYSCTKCGMDYDVHEDYGLPSHLWIETEAETGKSSYTCTRCHHTNTFISAIGDFCYQETLSAYTIESPNAKHEGFLNTARLEITDANDAVTRAKLELTVEYDTVSVSYDRESCVWCVFFSSSDAPDRNQSVYLHSDGPTCYIVYDT